MTIETTITAVVANVTIVANQSRFTGTGRRSTVRVTLTDSRTSVEKLAYTADRRLSAETVVDRLSRAIAKGSLRTDGMDFYYDFHRAIKAA